MVLTSVEKLAVAATSGLWALTLGVLLAGGCTETESEPATEDPAAEVEEDEAAEEQAGSTDPEKRTPPEAPREVEESAYTTTESGLQYHDATLGSGKSPVEGSTVVVEYSGFLEDGSMFDSSYKRPAPFRFAIGKGQVIKGWDEGVMSMKVGGERQLKVPARLGYGARGNARIPPNSTLIFDVELLEVLPPRVPPEAPHEVAESDYTTTESGLKYYDIEEGDGPSPAEGQTVRVEYSGFLTDGTMFDSSYKRADAIAFPVGKGRVIKGWDEGVGSMKVGGKRQLYIPSDLAYGERGRPPVIPPASDLVFDVELVEIVE